MSFPEIILILATTIFLLSKALDIFMEDLRNSSKTIDIESESENEL